MTSEELDEYLKKVRKAESKSAAWFWHNKSPWDTADFHMSAPISRPRPSDESVRRLRRLHAAIERVRYYAPECLPTLRLILKNINNRKESIYSLARSTPHTKIWEAAERTYYNHLKKLLRLFNVQGGQPDDSH